MKENSDFESNVVKIQMDEKLRNKERMAVKYLKGDTKDSVKTGTTLTLSLVLL